MSEPPAARRDADRSDQRFPDFETEVVPRMRRGGRLDIVRVISGTTGQCAWLGLTGGPIPKLDDRLSGIAAADAAQLADHAQPATGLLLPG